MHTFELADADAAYLAGYAQLNIAERGREE
jgi:hypothetical protein